MQQSVVLCRPLRLFALHGAMWVVVATLLAPIAADAPDERLQAKEAEIKKFQASLERKKDEAAAELAKPAETATETSESGHIIFKAARRKHKHDKTKKKTQEEATHAANAAEAAETASQAAKVAHKVATHAESIEANAADALAYAKHALHGAAVNAGGMSKDALQDAVDRVGEASDGAAAASRYSRSGTSTDSMDTKEIAKLERKLGRLQDELDHGHDSKAGAGSSEGAQVDSELRKLQQKLDAMKRAQQSEPGGVNAATEALQERLRDLERQMKASEVARAAGIEPPPGTATEDELKVKLEETREDLGKLSGSQSGASGASQPSGDTQQRLRELQEKLDKLRQLRAKEAQLKADPDNEGLKAEVDRLRQETGAGTTPGEAEKRLAAEISKLESEINATPGSSGGIDIDAQLPYGSAEPFGREGTAMDLTKSSKQEGDAMVDQIERAETMEERRAVFRALTRLRGATITAYDGIAKSHMNNVVQYNKEHHWRSEHPMRHLAQEEDDTGKWAFPKHSEVVPPAAAGSVGPASAPAPAAKAPGS